MRVCSRKSDPTTTFKKPVAILDANGQQVQGKLSMVLLGIPFESRSTVLQEKLNLPLEQSLHANV